MHRILVLAGLLGGAFPVLAQSAAPTPPGAKPDPTPGFDASIVVTASASEESQDTTAATVTVITAAEMASRQATTVQEALRTVPGLAFSQSGSPGHATSLFTRGTDSNQTLVLWNGVPLNEPYIGGFDWSSLSTEGVERVEVVRGPFSALYGSAALGGVVQVLGGPASGVDARLEGGDDAWRRAALAAGQAFGNLQLGVTGHVLRSEGEQRNDFFDSDAATATARWRGAGWTLGLLGRYNRSEIGIPRSGSEVTPHQQQETTDRQLSVPLSWTSPRWSLEGSLSRNATDLAYRDPDNAFGYTRADTETATDRARASGTLGLRAGLALSLGGDWQRQQVTDGSVFGVNLQDVHRRQWGGFGELRWQIGAITASAGVRHDDDQSCGTHSSPRLGMRWSFAPAWSVRVSYGEAFRAPSFSELYYPGSGNPALRPETSRSAELGLAWEPGSWSARVTAFRNQLRELIDFDFATYSSVNVGRARTQGVEAEVGFSRPSGSLRANATYLEATNLADRTDLLNRPRWSASVVGSWNLAAWSLSATERYAGERRSYPYVQVPGYAVTDLAASWRQSALLQPYLRVRNAFDRRYEEVLGYPAARRTLVGGVSLHF